MADVTIKLEPPLAFIQQQSGAFRRALEDFMPLWERFEQTLSDIEFERFETHGYGEWPALADSTLAQKAAGGWPLDPLIRTHALLDSLTDPNDTWSASEKEPMKFVWGTAIDYAEYHQDGTETIPPRPILDIRTEDRRRLEADQASWLNATARLTWGRI